ncbi:MAG: DoxX family protein [Candidatus Zixiibacteriota bacterium]|nr:MAG: DoxX family protein [candidate division Zixibacteria bacterium]
MTRFWDWILSRNIIAGGGTLTSIGLLVLRVTVGLMMAFGHGLGKLVSYGVRAANFPDPFGIGSPVSLGMVVFAEFFCSLALVLGFLTRSAAIPLIIAMLVAAFVIHGDDPFGRKELALMYLASFVVILIAGPGKYSLDRLFSRKQMP